MKVFVVNLPSQADRRALMVAQLKFVAPEAEIVRAVDGRALSVEELTAQYDRRGALQRCGRELTRGEIGCALSHQSIYRRMISDAIPWAVIMEDDVLVGRDFRPILETVAAGIDPTRPLVCLFSHVDKYTNWGRRRVLRRYWLVKPVRASGGRCYLLTAAAAKALLAENCPIRMPIDAWMYFRKRGVVDVTAIAPYCVGFAPCERDSLIEPDRKVREQARKRTVVGIATAWVTKYIYWRLFYQLGIKQLLRIKKQRDIW